MEIWLYDWSKKDNSTARPDLTKRIIMSGTIKGAVSVTAPIIVLENPLNSSGTSKYASKFNYAYIPQFKRYYWVTGKVIDQTGIVTISLSVDVLASIGDSIRSLSAFVSRSSFAFDGNYADGAYISESTPNVIRNDISGYTPSVLANGGFVVGTSSPVSTGITYWFFEQAAFKDLIRVLNDPIALCRTMGHTVDDAGIISSLADSVKGLTAEMYVSLYNPIQFIKSVVFYPKLPTFHYTAAIPFRLGDLTFNYTGATVAAYPMDDLSFYGTYGIATEYGGNVITVSVPKHPQASARGAYLNQSPFSQYHMSVPGYGTFEIDSSKLGEITTLYFKIATDFRDGSGVLYIDSNANRWGEIAQIHGKSGITWGLGQRSADFSTSSLIASALASGMNVVGNLMGKSGKTESIPVVDYDIDKIKEMYNLNGSRSNWSFGWSMVGQQQQKFAEAILQSGTTIRDAASSFIDGLKPVTHMSFAGSTGTLAEFLAEGFIELYYFNMSEERNEDIGRPLNDNKTLGNLTGFCMCVNPHVISTDFTKPEVDAVNSALEAGVILDWGGYPNG